MRRSPTPCHRGVDKRAIDSRLWTTGQLQGWMIYNYTQQYRQNSQTPRARDLIYYSKGQHQAKPVC